MHSGIFFFNVEQLTSFHEGGWGACGPRAIERGLHWIFYKTEMKNWAVGCGLGWTVLKKVWADYEQLLREVISTFCGQKKKKFF